MHDSVVKKRKKEKMLSHSLAVFQNISIELL